MTLRNDTPLAGIHTSRYLVLVRKLFRLPELLLFAGPVLMPVIVGNSAVDIQYHDVYLIFKQTSWGLNHFFVLIDCALFLTWLVHLFCRKFRLLAAGWRWLQVGGTLAATMVITIGLLSPLARSGSYFEGFNPPAWERFQLLLDINSYGTFSLLLFQLIFWICVPLIFIVRLIERRTRKL